MNSALLDFLLHKLPAYRGCRVDFEEPNSGDYFVILLEDEHWVVKGRVDDKPIEFDPWLYQLAPTCGVLCAAFILHYLSVGRAPNFIPNSPENEALCVRAINEWLAESR